MDRVRTPAAPTGEILYRQILLTIPSNADLMRYFWGAASSIAFYTAWVKEGTMEVEQATLEIKKILDSVTEVDMIGEIKAFYRESAPTNTLLCDGSVYNKSEYPQLWDVLPSASKDATTFTVPDLREKFLLGASMDYPVTYGGGVAEVTLTTDQIPPHTHSYQNPTFNVDVESVGVPDPTGVGMPMLPATSGSTGGGQAHDNMPPFVAVGLYIVAKVRA